MLANITFLAFIVLGYALGCPLAAAIIYIIFRIRDKRDTRALAKENFHEDFFA